MQNGLSDEIKTKTVEITLDPLNNKICQVYYSIFRNFHIDARKHIQNIHVLNVSQFIVVLNVLKYYYL